MSAAIKTFKPVIPPGPDRCAGYLATAERSLAPATTASGVAAAASHIWTNSIDRRGRGRALVRSWPMAGDEHADSFWTGPYENR